MKRTSPNRLPRDYPLDSHECLAADVVSGESSSTSGSSGRAVTPPDIAYAQLLERHRANLPITEAMIRETTAQLRTSSGSEDSVDALLPHRLRRLLQAVRRTS